MFERFRKKLAGLIAPPEAPALPPDSPVVNTHVQLQRGLPGIGKDQRPPPRTHREKRTAVLAILADPLTRDRSDRDIAEACDVSHPFVARMRTVIEKVDRPELAIEPPRVISASTSLEAVAPTAIVAQQSWYRRLEGEQAAIARADLHSGPHHKKLSGIRWMGKPVTPDEIELERPQDQFSHGREFPSASADPVLVVKERQLELPVGPQEAA